MVIWLTNTLSCIALSGLGAHAFGSWQARDSSFMWLRDKLPGDLPNARVLIYGYDTKLAGSQSFQTLNDIAAKVYASLENLMENLDHRRSFIFIAHGLGGLVLKKALVQMTAAGRNAIFAIFFFGVPNQGMDTSSLYPMVHGQPNLPLVAGLDRNNDYLYRLVKRFDNVFGSSHTSIVTFYETLESCTAKKDSSGKWSMSGDSVVLVDRHSATYGLLSSKVFPINRNHFDMVRFKNKYDTVCNIVCGQLMKSATQAPAVIYTTFKNASGDGSASAIVKSPEKPSIAFHISQPKSPLSVLLESNDQAHSDVNG